MKICYINEALALRGCSLKSIEEHAPGVIEAMDINENTQVLVTDENKIIIAEPVVLATLYQQEQIKTLELKIPVLKDLSGYFAQERRQQKARHREQLANMSRYHSKHFPK